MRLGRQYDAFETGKLGITDLAPKIKSLKSEIDDLQTKRSAIIERAQDVKADAIEASVVTAYVKDLKALLGKGSIIEQKSFLRSFLKKAVFDGKPVAIDYTVPINQGSTEALASEVLPLVRSGSSGRCPGARWCGA